MLGFRCDWCCGMHDIHQSQCHGARYQACSPLCAGVGRLHYRLGSKCFTVWKELSQLRLQWWLDVLRLRIYWSPWYCNEQCLPIQSCRPDPMLVRQSCTRRKDCHFWDNQIIRRAYPTSTRSHEYRDFCRKQLLQILHPWIFDLSRQMPNYN